MKRSGEMGPECLTVSAPDSGKLKVRQGLGTDLPVECTPWEGLHAHLHWISKVGRRADEIAVIPDIVFRVSAFRGKADLPATWP